jgi:hypothetical protein
LKVQVISVDDDGWIASRSHTLELKVQVISPREAFAFPLQGAIHFDQHLEEIWGGGVTGSAI